MLKNGPIPLFLHGVIEYLAGFIFILAPFVIDWDKPSATAVSLVVGVLVLFIAASSDLPTGLTKRIPKAVHVILDFALVALLLAAPFLFGFSERTEPTVFFLVIGAAHLLVTLGTRFRDGDPEPESA